MIDNIKKFFAEKINTAGNRADSSRLRSVPIATCALLLEMAHADSEFSEEEKNNIISILSEHFDLNTQDAQELIRLAEFERKESLDLWQFTNLINQNYNREDKINVVETLWRVVYSDNQIDKHEEYLMRRLTFLLNLDHKDMIEAKFRAQQNIQNDL